MSEQTWIDEFYPVDAQYVPKYDALQHSLTKWEGLTKASLHKHGLATPPIEINADTCALCYTSNPYSCDNCPLYLERKGYSCCIATKYEPISPFEAWLENRNPLPMIKLLKSIKE